MNGIEQGSRVRATSGTDYGVGTVTCPLERRRGLTWAIVQFPGQLYARRLLTSGLELAPEPVAAGSRSRAVGSR